MDSLVELNDRLKHLSGDLLRVVALSDQSSTLQVQSHDGRFHRNLTKMSDLATLVDVLGALEVQKARVITK